MNKLKEEDIKHFNILKKVIKAGHSALVLCKDRKTGKEVPVICAINYLENDKIDVVPFAKLFNENDDNPYDSLIPPTDDEFDTKVNT